MSFVEKSLAVGFVSKCNLEITWFSGGFAEMVANKLFCEDMYNDKLNLQGTADMIVCLHLRL